jgi:hypothetical protein
MRMVITIGEINNNNTENRTMAYTRTIAKLENKNGDPVALMATIGGNKGTGDVVSLTLVPLTVYLVMREKLRGIGAHISAVAKLYVELMDSVISVVCGHCPLRSKEIANKIGHQPCYVQRNIQNAGQPATHCIKSEDEIDGMGWDLEGFASMLDDAGSEGMNTIRSMVAGDAGMMKEEDWETLEAFVANQPRQWKWLGYTHQQSSTWLQGTHQLSTQSINNDTYGQAHYAIKKGWSPFHVLGDHVTEIDDTFTLCFKQDRKAQGKSGNCMGCPTPCDGKSGNATVVVNHNYGQDRKKTSALPMWTGR